MTAPTVDPATGEILDDSIEVARRQLGQALTELGNEAMLADQPADLARALAYLRDLKQDAATIYTDVEARYLDHLEEHGQRVEVPGLGLVETHRRTKRTGWDHDALVVDVLQATADEAGVTEVAELDPWQAVAALQLAISFGAGKVTRLRALGLQPDEYCKETPDGWTVQLPPRNHTGDVA